MALLPPNIQTYHCICASLLLASTHTLSTLPKRTTISAPTSDGAIILPLPSSPPEIPPPHTNTSNGGQDMPPEGYSMLLGMVPDKKITIVRREDGFEKRVLYRCSRCRLVVGYELEEKGYSEVMDLDGEEGGKGKGREGCYEGKVVYLLPAGIMSTDVMMGKDGKRITEEDVRIKRGAVTVFE